MAGTRKTGAAKPKAAASHNKPLAPQNEAVVVPVRIVKRSAAQRRGKPIKVKILDEPKGANIYVDTPDLDRLEAERARRHRRTVRNLTISASTLFCLLVAAGIGYTWYIDKKAPPPVMAAAPVATTPKQIVPQAPAPSVPVGVASVSFTTPVRRGDSVSLYIQTLAGAKCTIAVSYANVPDSQPVLKPVTADSFGSASWIWTPPSGVPDGDWPVLVTCVRNGKTGVLKQTLSIID